VGLAIELRGQSAEHIGEIRLRLPAIELGRLDRLMIAAARSAAFMLYMTVKKGLTILRYVFLFCNKPACWLNLASECRGLGLRVRPKKSWPPTSF